MNKCLLLFLTFSFISFYGVTQSFDAQKLDAYFDTLAFHQKFMGSLEVTKDGEVIYANQLGYKDIENEVKANENTIYRIGSISKTFTSVLIFQTIEAKKIKLNQKLSKFFPEIPNAKKITIEQLLRHRSGIHNFTNDENYWTWNTLPKTREEMLEIIKEGGSDFQPGSQFAYSNSNYVLLSFILEDIYKKTYQEILKEMICDPIGLQHTSIGEKIDVAVHECYSYKPSNKGWIKETETILTIPIGAGGIVSTPSELNQFNIALNEGKLVAPESLKQMQEVIGGFGMGLIAMPFYGKMGYGHTGGIDGFHSVSIYIPSDKISYSIISNGLDYNMNNISIAVLSAIYKLPFTIPTFTDFKISVEDLKQYVGVYSSEEIPMKLTFTIENEGLVGQATGQAPFPLEAVSENEFQFDMAGVVLVFYPEKKEVTLKQGGGEFLFKKE